MAWKDLTPAQQAAWKKKNFNPNIKVPQSAIDKLNAGKTKANNVKKYAGTDNKIMREAMNRFYGKGWDKGGNGGGGSKPKPKVNKPQSNQRGGGRFVDDKPGIPKGASKPKPKTTRPNRVPVTSVTPTITTKRVSDKRAARTREMLGALATVAGVGGVVRGGLTLGAKALGARTGASTVARITGKTGAQQAALTQSRLNAIKMQQSQGLITKGEAQKLIIDANLKYNRANTLRVAEGQSGVVYGTTKAAVKRALTTQAAKAAKVATRKANTKAAMNRTAQAAKRASKAGM